MQLTETGAYVAVPLGEQFRLYYADMYRSGDRVRIFTAERLCDDYSAEYYQLPVRSDIQQSAGYPYRLEVVE